ncbi:hypothetical protein HQQ80_19350 [Microbacteriaceae bacterium VKM Ac-2855]|nr:hypothetical protein [Microbacteriaceae bacterium VKM Ac-2855]
MAVSDVPSAVVIRALLCSIEEPGAINAGLAADLRRSLRELVSVGLSGGVRRGTAFDGRLIAIVDVPDVHEYPHRPAV